MESKHHIALTQKKKKKKSKATVYTMKVLFLWTVWSENSHENRHGKSCNKVYHVPN